MADQIARAQSDLEAQLASLQRAGLADGNTPLMEELRGQLHILHSLGQFLSGAQTASLYQIRAEVATSVAASHSLAQQVETTVATGQAAEIAQHVAEYAAAAADIDRRVAATFVTDRSNDALAHAMAKRFGIDLAAYDAEREGLARDRADAIRRGDKIAERQADVLMAQNTFDTMAASADKITDREERRRYLQQMQQEQEILELRKRALAEQLELEARRTAREKGLTPEETTAYVTQLKTQGMAAATDASRHLVGADRTSAIRLQLEADGKAAQADAAKASPALATVAPVLTLEAELKTKEAAQAITKTGQADIASISLNMDDSSTIALSTAPDAHSRVEVPQLPAASVASKVQSLA